MDATRMLIFRLEGEPIRASLHGHYDGVFVAAENDVDYNQPCRLCGNPISSHVWMLVQGTLSEIALTGLAAVLACSEAEDGAWKLPATVDDEEPF